MSQIISLDGSNLPNDWMIAMESYEVAPDMINFRYRAYCLRPVPKEHRTPSEPALAWKSTTRTSHDEARLRRELWGLGVGE